MSDSSAVPEPWRMLDGPATMQPRGTEWDICWVWLIGRGEEKRHVAVYVAFGCLRRDDLADESKRAVDTRGEAAVAVVLDEAAARLAISPHGVGRL